MYPGPPSPPWEKDGGQRTGGVRPVQIFPGNVPSAQQSSQADARDMGKGTGTRHSAAAPTRRHHPCSSCCLHTAVGVQVVLPVVPGRILAGDVAVKRGSLIVLDFGLDVFCHVADS